MGVLKERTWLAQGRGGGLRAVAMLLGVLALSLAGDVRGATSTLASAAVEHAGSTGTFTSVTMVDDGTGGDTTAADGVFTAQVPVYSNDLPRYRFTYTLGAATSTPVVDVGTTPTTLFINELMASNSTTVLDPQGEADDWIELKNTGTAAIDLGGMYLSDDASNPTQWQFPAGTSIGAGGYLLVWADDDDGDSPGLHTNFRLSAGGESVVLSDVDARSNALIDSVTFPAQTTDVSYGRSPEATGSFQALAVASPGRATPNLPEIAIRADGPVTEGDTATFSITSAPAPTAELSVGVSVAQATGDDYLPATLPTSVTIASAATAATLSVAIPNDTVDEPNGVLTVTIAAGTGYTVSATNGSASLTIRDDDANPAASPVVINELMASNSTTALDPQGDADDWIELMNTSDATIDLSGMYLSDDRAKAKKWRFPAGTTIAAGGYLLVWADNDTDDSPGLHANFKLSSGGESLVLSDNDTNGNTVIDAVDFPALGSDLSYGRVPEGSGSFQVIGSASPGAALPAVPTVTVASTGPATEGGTASFIVAASYAPTSAVTVNVSVTQGSGQSYLPASRPTSVTIAANAKATTLEVSLPDDAVDEPNGVITATVGAGAGYLLGSPAAASTTARDNDGGSAMSAVAINELMASNTNTILDPQGDDDDWIELKNTTSATVDLSGMYLSDDASDPKKWPLPAGTSLAGEAYLLIWADDDDGDSPGLHANFKLSAKGETVVLSDSDANGNTLIDVVVFGALDEDESFGRMPNGSGAFRTLPATPGAANPIVPTLTILAGPTATEGGTANFTIRADPAPAADLAVDVSVTQEAGADYLPAAPPTSVTIAANANRATLAVALPDDAVDEPNGDITARIVASTDGRYDVATDSATLSVHDNDPPPPLTAAFHGMPASHDATGLIRFELRFSEDFPGAAGLRDLLLGGALRVTNGTVSQVDRATPGQNRNWSIGVRPDSYADVSVALPATTDCDAAGAVCAEDGRPLSNGLSATVEGLPPLTAAFHGMPASHDATGLIRFELRFSEEFAGTAGLRDALLGDAFLVANGSVREASRATHGQNRVWSIGVRPDTYEDVTVELPATVDCDAAGAVCAVDGRLLSNGLTATVEGPPPLTAAFAGVPTSHDGSSPFEFELRFSENFGGAHGLPATIEDAFHVTNGVVDRVARVEPGQNRRWTVGVRPEAWANVTVELPATDDCEDSGAVCAEDGRPLSNSLSAEVPGEAANAQADGPVLTLTWSSPRDGFAAPGGSDFAVRVDGDLRPVTSVALWTRGAVLTLADPVLAGQAVVVDYLGSAMHPLRDAAGVPEPAWRDLPAVNVTGRSGVRGGDPAPGAGHAWLPSADGLSASFAGRKLGDAGLAALPVRADVRRLELSGNALTDISALVRFRDLRSLDLSGNAVSDIAPLRRLTKLRRLDLGDNDVVDLWPLAELPHLEVLLLDRNRVANVGAVTHLGYLENLALSGNPVEDLSPLADLGSLRRLDLGDSPARDLSPVGDLGALVWLRLPLGGSGAPVHRLTRLRWLLAPGTPGTCLGCAGRETADEQ